MTGPDVGATVAFADYARDVEALCKQLADAQATVEALQKKYDDLLGKYRQLVDFYDKHNGTPCEQIRHQQQVEALQRERDEAIKAASCPTWVCNGCGRVSRDGWITHIIESMDGVEYEMECPVCEARAIEEDSAVDLARERDNLQDALDAEREKVKGLEGQYQRAYGRAANAEQAVTELKTELSQLQALVRAKEAAYEKILLSRERLEREVRGYPPVDNEGIPMVWQEPVGWVKRTLDATTPATTKT